MRRLLLVSIACLAAGCGSTTSVSTRAVPVRTPPSRPLSNADVMPPPLAEPAMAYDAATRTVVMFGGSQALPTNMTWSWDGSAWRRLHPLHSPSARQGAGLAYDPTHGVLILFGGVSYTIGDESKPRGAGGSDQSTVDGDTWTWDGADWRQMNNIPQTTALRPDPMLAWDASDNAVVRDDVCSTSCYFGGGRTWMWDWPSASWVQAHTPGSIPWNEAGQGDDAPAALGIQTPVFDAARTQGDARAVAADPATGGLLFVGRGQNPILQGREPPAPVDHKKVETWTWMRGAWKALAPTTVPPGNSLPTPTLAPTGVSGQELLFDGWGETWLWDGATWSGADGVNPGVRGGAAMAFDEATGQVVLFGGEASGAGGLLADTWVWKGGAWNRAAGPPGSFAAPVLPIQPDPPASLGAANCKSMKAVQPDVSEPPDGTTTIHILTRERELAKAGVRVDGGERTGVTTQPGRLMCLVAVRCTRDVPCMISYGGGLTGCGATCPSPTPRVPTIAYLLSEGDAVTSSQADSSGGGPASIARILQLPNLLDT